MHEIIQLEHFIWCHYARWRLLYGLRVQMISPNMEICHGACADWPTFFPIESETDNARRREREREWERFSSTGNWNIIFTNKLHRIIQFIKVFIACMHNLSIIRKEWGSENDAKLMLAHKMTNFCLTTKSFITFAIDTHRIGLLVGICLVWCRFEWLAFVVIII